jgi:TPP-dependent pyruvate/acetoin dehydrogenase alpha subunit
VSKHSETSESRASYLVDKGCEAYFRMSLIRSFENEVVRLAAENRVSGGVHVAIGQEACSVGVCQNLLSTDSITSTHRAHGDCLAKGVRPERIFAELLGKVTGFAKGRAGTMHITDVGVRVLGANGIVGACIPVAVGAALCAQVKGVSDVAVTFFGEGAVAQGVFHESLNLAALWKLPVIFLCENNQYAEMLHYSLHLAESEIWKFANNYGIPGERVDGNDVYDVYRAANDAVRRARSGAGPSLIECFTYRMRGHYEGDGQRYRSKDEVAIWQDRDPIRRLSDELQAENVADSSSLSDLDARALKVVKDALRAAEDADDAAGEEVLLMDVLSP